VTLTGSELYTDGYEGHEAMWMDLVQLNPRALRLRGGINAARLGSDVVRHAHISQDEREHSCSPRPFVFEIGVASGPGGDVCLGSVRGLR
jgi:hypothetical protein